MLKGWWNTISVGFSGAVIYSAQVTPTVAPWLCMFWCTRSCHSLPSHIQCEANYKEAIKSAVLFFGHFLSKIKLLKLKLLHLAQFTLLHSVLVYFMLAEKHGIICFSTQTCDSESCINQVSDVLFEQEQVPAWMCRKWHGTICLCVKRGISQHFKKLL